MKEIICVKITDKENLKNVGINRAATEAWRLDIDHANSSKALVAFVDNVVNQVFFDGKWVETGEEGRLKYVDYKVATISDLIDLELYNILYYNIYYVFPEGDRNPVRYLTIV